MKDVVYKESTDELVSFTDVEVSNLSVPELHLFCVAHNISGNKNKESSNTLLLIVLCTWAMVVENITYPPLSASDYGNNGGSGIDLSNKRCHVAENLFVNADIDNEECVVTEEEKDPQYKQRGGANHFVNQQQGINPEQEVQKIPSYKYYQG